MGWFHKVGWWAGNYMVAGVKALWDYTHKRVPTPAARIPQFSTQGHPIPFGYGLTRGTGNVLYFKRNIWAGNNATIIGLCEGPIGGITRVWKDQKVEEVTWGGGYSNDLGGIFRGKRGTLALGTRPTQTGWSALQQSGSVEEGNFYPGDPNAYPITYPGTAYLGYFNSTAPENLVGYSFEMKLFYYNTGGSQGDAHPANVLQDFLLNSQYGCNVGDNRVVVSVGTNGLADSSCMRYATAEGFWISPWFSEQREAREHLRELCESTNLEIVWKPYQPTSAEAGAFWFLPYGDVAVTGNGVTYTPDTTIQCELTSEDLIPDGDGEKITVDIVPEMDHVNCWPVEFLERSPTPQWKASTAYLVGQLVRNGNNVYRCSTGGTSAGSGGPSGTGATITDGGVTWMYEQAFDKSHAYNVAVVESPDTADAAIHGIKRAPTANLHAICLREVAQKISSIRSRRAARARATFTFRLGWRFCRLEPFDLVSIPFWDERRVVRIESIEEDADYTLTIRAEDWPEGIGGSVAHDTQSGEGHVEWTTTDYRAIENASGAEVDHAQETADQAASDAADAVAAAAGAVTAANGKNRNFYQTTAPTSGMVEGDLWFDTDDHHKPYKYVSSTWTAMDRPPIVAGEIDAGAVTADTIAANALKTGTYTFTGTEGGTDEVATAGAKMQSSGTALLVAPGNLKVGNRYIESTGICWAKGRIDLTLNSNGPYPINGAKNIANTNYATRVAGGTGWPSYVIRVDFTQAIATERFATPIIHVNLAGQLGQSIDNLNQVTPVVVGLREYLTSGTFDAMYIGFRGTTGTWWDPAGVGDLSVMFSVLGEW